MIDLKNVSRSFDGKIAVRDLTLSVPPGCIFACVGPNGAGKTTTIRMIVGLLLPTAGAITVGGHDVVREPVAAKRLLGYVPDQPFLYDKLTGREFLHFVGRIYSMPPPDVERGVAEFAALFEMTGYLDELCESYSHGMKQRVVLASALLHDPRVIVVDEPMVGLDPAGVRLVSALLRARARDGVTVFMSTHTLSLVEDLADEIGVLHKAELVYRGSVADLRARRGAGGKLEDAFFQLTLEEDASLG
ncbi:MAG: ABC transporter ATP-binding protein [Planctomycetota bacterium]